MKNNKLKIADFGLARKIVSNTHYTQNRGTHGYQAPQVVKGLNYSQKCDVYSFGCVFYKVCIRFYVQVMYKNDVIKVGFNKLIERMKDMDDLDFPVEPVYS